MKKIKNLRKIVIYLASPWFLNVLPPDVKRTGPRNIKGALAGLRQFLATDISI